MAKNLKLNIKNTQIAQAINLGGLKGKLEKKKARADTPAPPPSKTAAAKSAKVEKVEEESQPREEAPRIKARSRSAFAEPLPSSEQKLKPEEAAEEKTHPSVVEPALEEAETEEQIKSSHGGAPEIISDTDEISPAEANEAQTEASGQLETISEKEHQEPASAAPQGATPTQQAQIQRPAPAPHSKKELHKKPEEQAKEAIAPPRAAREQPEKLGPTGRHIKDLLAPVYQQRPASRKEPVAQRGQQASRTPSAEDENRDAKQKQKARSVEPAPAKAREDDDQSAAKKGSKTPKVKEFRDLKPAKKSDAQRTFDARDRHGLRVSEEEQTWRKRRPKHKHVQHEDTTIRPSSLKVRIPISIKDLASEMKLKASQLIAKLFLQGLVVTLNDLLEDETTIQLLGHEFGCEISIDSSEEERIRITDQSIKEEIDQAAPEQLAIRPPVVAFMGHVDHGKTSLIDSIRASNRVAGEAGAITQHIGAFRCHTDVGDIAILDTPGHEAFSAMRARGADVTDIVVLVVAGDEGVKPQTVEAIQHAKAAKVTIVVALNKCDKPSFNPENVYRQLAEQELLPEAWGGQTITVNCSAVTGEGIKTLLEMLALQAEVLELKANPHDRARGSVLESEMHKGMGAMATVLVQNGTLKIGDALVFGQHWGRVKTMRDEFGQEMQEASPSTPVAITGLSGLPEAGEEFIAVKNEREAREIAEARLQGMRQVNLQQKKKLSMENLLQQASETTVKKILNVVLRADVQGSLEALKVALQKIESQKADLNIIFAGVGEVTESDVQLASASKAMILGFHTQIESHAETLVKQLGVQVRLHDIIYHAIDDVKALMVGLLDKIAIETEKGKAEVKATFKSSHHGIIAGCQVTEGSIHRNHSIRVRRENEVVWKGQISSLKRVKEDVREVQKGLECGILLTNFSDVREGDILESYEITYMAQEL